jgi:hypothetical protein
MADIAAVFGWPLSEMLKLSVNDLRAWRERAIDRWNRMYGEEET